MQGGASRLSVLLPLTAAAFILVGVSGAFFNDTETTSGNILGAGTWTPAPTPTPKIAQTLVINEVLPNSDCNLGGDKIAQWIEIYNGYPDPVNLKDFQIQDKNGIKVALVNAGNIIVQPGGLALLSHDNSIWNKCYDDNNVITANFGTGNLDLNTGVLRLLDSLDVVIDRVEWEKDVTPALNVSIERHPAGLDNDLGDIYVIKDLTVQSPPSPGIKL